MMRQNLTNITPEEMALLKEHSYTIGLVWPTTDYGKVIVKIKSAGRRFRYEAGNWEMERAVFITTRDGDPTYIGEFICPDAEKWYFAGDTVLGDVGSKEADEFVIKSRWGQVNSHKDLSFCIALLQKNINNIVYLMRLGHNE